MRLLTRVLSSFSKKSILERLGLCVAIFSFTPLLVSLLVINATKTQIIGVKISENSPAIVLHSAQQYTGETAIHKQSKLFQNEFDELIFYEDNIVEKYRRELSYVMLSNKYIPTKDAKSYKSFFQTFMDIDTSVIKYSIYLQSCFKYKSIKEWIPIAAASLYEHRNELSAKVTRNTPLFSIEIRRCAEYALPILIFTFLFSIAISFFYRFTVKPISDLIFWIRFGERN